MEKLESIVMFTTMAAVCLLIGYSLGMVSW